MIRIFALVIDYGNIFSKSKTNMDNNGNIKKDFVFPVI